MWYLNENRHKIKRNRISVPETELRTHKYVIHNKGNQKRGGESMREEIDPGFN